MTDTFISCSHCTNLTAELAMPIGILTKETKPEMEPHPVTAEAKKRKCLI